MRPGTIIAQREALRGLLETWEDDAERVKRYDPGDPKARVLAACAGDLRRVLGEDGVEWVSLASVQGHTGWSYPTLRRRCVEELEARGEAEKRDGGKWYVPMHIALAWPQKPEGGAPDRAANLDELARLAGREE